jgi:hypothetical protein
MGQDLMKRGKKVVEAVKPIAKKVGEAVSGAVDTSKIGSDLEDMASTAQEIPGMKKAAGVLSGATDKAASAIEPNFIKPSLTPFDTARAVASGAVRTTGDFLAGLIPETTMGAAAYAIPADAVLKYAGLTFPTLAKDIHLPGWKPKTGLSTEATKIGDQFEKLVTQENINQHVRANIDQMKGTPPKPLEIVANEEAKIKAQTELSEYEAHLKALDDLSARGGEPTGDLYPQAKTNISQLRDMARERLQKLQNEPVRVESLSRAEDELQGYYRRKIDQARVYLQPSGPETKPQALLGGPEKPAGLLEEGKPPIGAAGQGRTKPAAPSPLPKSTEPTGGPKPTAPLPAASPEEMPTRIKGYLQKMYQTLYPDQPKEANAVRVGAAMKGFGKYGFTANEELSAEKMNFIDTFLDQEYSENLAKAEKRPISKEINPRHDPVKVKAEASRLKAEHDYRVKNNMEARSALRSATQGIDYYKPDPITGVIPMKEEIDRNVPKVLRGKTPPDLAAKMAFDEGLIPEPTDRALLEYTRTLMNTERPRALSQFVPEAENILDHQAKVDAGFEPPDQVHDAPKFGSVSKKPAQQDLLGEAETFSLGGEKAPPSEPVGGGEGSQTTVPGTEPKFNAKDIKDQSAHDLAWGLFKNLDEKGQVGGEIDPVRQAQQEAIIKELVTRARSLGYQTSQDVMLYVARNAPKEMQDALRKNLAPTLSAFDDHAYKEMDEARKGNPVAKKSMMDAAQRNYFQQKSDIVKGVYKKFKANQQVVLFKDMDEGLMRLKNDLFIHDNYRKFTKDELAAQRWYTEGKSPKLESLTALGIDENTAKKWLDLAKNPTDNMKKARPMTQIFEDEYHDVLSELYDRVGYREDHVTRRWKRPEEYLDFEGRTLGNRPNFLKGAKLVSQAQGIDAGLEPVSFDIREDLRASNNARVNVLSRIHAYQKLGASFGPDGMPAIIDESKDLLTQAKNAKITPHSGDAPASWIRTNDVPLLRGLAINPYYKPAMKFMMSRPFTGTTPEVLNFLSASTKACKLYGFFHGYTLGEMTASGISYRDVFSFSKNRNPLFRGLRYFVKGATADLEGETLEWGTPAKGIKSIGKIYNSFLTGSGMLANRPMALDMAEQGFKFGSADEDMHGILHKTLNALEKQLTKKIGEGAAKGITALPRTALDIQEKALWSYIRPISSMLVYETNLKDAILKFNIEAPEGKKMAIDQIKQAIVNQTSKEMGGISYARLMINPRTQQVLQWAMLAPGWTIGRALMGASVLEKGPEGRQARKQMAKLFVGWFFASNMINYAQTKKDLGKGRYMWENPEGYRNQAFLSKEKDGSTRYLQLSKALTEIYDDIDHPLRTGAYKLSAPLQAAVKVYNWATRSAYSPGTEPENPLMAAVHAYEPMITSGNSAYGGLPLKRGPSKNKVEAVLDEYYKGGMKNQALFQEAMQTGIEQGYDMSKLDRAVRANRTRKERKALLQ